MPGGQMARVQTARPTTAPAKETVALGAVGSSSSWLLTSLESKPQLLTMTFS